MRPLECRIHLPENGKNIIFGFSQLCRSLELDARHVPHDLPKRLCYVLDLIVQEYRLNNSVPFEGVDPIRNIPAMPKDGWITEKGILCRTFSNVALRHCNVPLHQGGRRLRGDKCPSKGVAAHPLCYAQQDDSLHVSHHTARDLGSYVTAVLHLLARHWQS